MTGSHYCSKCGELIETYEDSVAYGISFMCEGCLSNDHFGYDREYEEVANRGREGYEREFRDFGEDW